VRTYDMMRISGGARAISQGAATTVQMTDAVLEQLTRHVRLTADVPDDELVEAGSHI